MKIAILRFQNNILYETNKSKLNYTNEVELNPVSIGIVLYAQLQLINKLEALKNFFS